MKQKNQTCKLLVCLLPCCQNVNRSSKFMDSVSFASLNQEIPFFERSNRSDAIFRKSSSKTILSHCEIIPSKITSLLKA